MNYQLELPASTRPTGFNFSLLLSLWQSFSVNRTVFDTIVTKDSLYSKIIGQRIGLSFLDSRVANIEYCTGENLASYAFLSDYLMFLSPELASYVEITFFRYYFR